MKQLILFFVVPILLSIPGAEVECSAVKTEVIQTDEKKILLNYYEETINDLKAGVDGLSEAQLQYKPSGEQWSVSQILEHIILTEKMLFGMMKEEMAKQPNPERRAEIRFSDEDIIKGMTDRSQKAKASEELEGNGAYISFEEAMEDVLEQRQLVLDYLKDISVQDLRDRVSDSPYGPMDAYQSFLFLAGHMARHTLQIEK
ncbi:hypothetical protein GCM10007103_05740 [Salinimicrobium marinum]|uniref:DinB-like domain-containing protein n=1 Tax=Salinimicrobium marinum TaxID=680283 RepID=A0A918S7J5_9FLAO|nr:DinB family protein [Salinimicrobium marinum]GHA27201.1 hypothetical protein GCM10007103_05740 [Salinimicrobium marinum]